MENSNGKGILDNCGLIDTLIMDCNELPRAMMSGHYVGFCAKIVEMVQKLSRLKDGVQQDTKELQNRIRELERINDELAGVTTETEVLPDGSGNNRADGAEH